MRHAITVSRALMTAFATTLTSGCSVTGPLPDEVPMAYTASKDCALIVVYREVSLDRIAQWDIPFLRIDERPVTRIRMGGFARFDLPPGSYELSTTDAELGFFDMGRIRKSVEVTVASEQVLFLRYAEDLNRFSFVQIPANEAQTELAELHLLPLSKSAPAPCSGS